MSSKPWVADGLKKEEQTVFQWLGHSHRQDRAGFAVELLNISLLDTIESADAGVIQSLYWLAGDPSQYRAVTAHPTLMDGIADYEAKVVAVWHGVNRENPLMRARFNLSLRGAQRRGNLDEAEHTSTNRSRHVNEIATLRSQ